MQNRPFSGIIAGIGRNFGQVVQWLERLSDKEEVGGSIPPLPINRREGPVAQLAERFICNEGVSGSNPLGSIRFLRPAPNRAMFLATRYSFGPYRPRLCSSHLFEYQVRQDRPDFFVCRAVGAGSRFCRQKLTAESCHSERQRRIPLKLS